ncbi:MAG: DUF4956 domain-containing protein [Tissierellia bacterium]|nr:DUF4956 domain-containing protein [Tissierellia bacterium]
MEQNTVFQQNMQQLIEVLESGPTHFDIASSLLATLLLSFLMWGTYKLAHSKATFQPEFAITLVTLSFVSTLLMILIRSNLALSLGMLGSLSIVRFRTNIQDPRDIGFIFWSMAIGIASATQNHMIGVIGSLVMATVFITTRNGKQWLAPMLLVIRGSASDIDGIQGIVEGTAEGSQVKAKNILSDSFELVFQIQIPSKEENALISKLFGLDGIDSVNLLAVNAKDI